MFGNNKITKFNTNTTNILQYYKIIFFILLISGFNYNAFKTNIFLKKLAKIYVLVLIIVITYATITCCDDQEISQIWSLIEYTSSTIIIIILNSNINNFFNRLSYLDTCLRINSRYYIKTRNKLIIFTITIWIVRIVYTTFYCVSYDCYVSLVSYLINQFSLLALDANRIWRFAIYDEVRFRLKTLRLRLEEGCDTNYYLYVNNNKSIKQDKIKFCMHLYGKIADAMELMTPEVHASLFVSVFCSLPKLIINVYHILLIIENHLPFESLGFMLIHIFQISFFLFSPCVASELCLCEVENIRRILIQKLVGEIDERTIYNIELFLNYTRIRDFRYKIWRMIPVDLSFPLEFINLGTTYVIVIVNFTHLYG